MSITLSVPSKTHYVLCRSSFQTLWFTTGCTWHAARRVPRPSPRLDSRPKESLRNSDQDKSNDVTFWPTELLRSAHSSGALSISWNEAIHFLNEFQDSHPDPRSESTKKLCSERRIEPLTMTLLAQILKRSGFKNCQPIARRLVIAASYLQDSAATLQLISEAIRTSNLTHPDIVGARMHLEILVKKDKNPAAMILLGKIRETQGKPSEALSLYESAANADSHTYTSAEAVEGSTAEAWANVSRLKVRLGDMKGAKAAIEKAALQYDDPMAYYYLATKFRAQGSADYPMYLMKAAASGMVEAAQLLGAYYDKKWKADLYVSLPEEGENSSTDGKLTTGFTSQLRGDSVSQRKMAEIRGLATEWFAVAAEAGLPYSQISLAILLRSGGLVEKGMEWLNRAEHSVEWVDAVIALRESWWDLGIDLAPVRVGGLKKRKT